LTVHDVSLPPAIARLCELLFDAVHAGARWAARCLADSDMVRTRRIVARITMILRHVLLMIAVRLEVKLRAAAPARLTPSPVSKVASGEGGAPRFPLWSPACAPARHPVFAAGEAQDAGLQSVPFPKSLDPGLGLRLPQDDGGWTEKTLHRKLAAIRAALDNPLRYARRIARALSNDRYIFLPPRIPRTQPPSDAQEFWAERLAAADEANFQYHSYWRRRRDSS
jgi:hypothetical protein